MQPDAAPIPDRTAPRALWAIAQTLLDILYTLFGTPADLAARGWITHKAYALMRPWLRAGEVLLRHLLLLEAAALTAKPPRASRRSRPRKRITLTFSADAPETWRVTFPALAPCDSLASIARTASPTAAPRDPAKVGLRGHRNAWPIAERFEALLRVYDNPAPYAARLARRLARTPGDVSRVLDAPDDAPPLIGAQSFADLRAATDARERWPNTG